MHWENSMRLVVHIYKCMMYNCTCFRQRLGFPVRVSGLLRLCATSHHAVPERSHRVFKLPAQAHALSNLQRPTGYAFDPSSRSVQSAEAHWVSCRPTLASSRSVQSAEAHWVSCRPMQAHALSNLDPQRHVTDQSVVGI